MDKVCPGVISCADTLAVAGAAAVQTVSAQTIPVFTISTIFSSYMCIFIQFYVVTIS